MRIISGAWRGRPLLSPPGQGTRPTSDRAREGLFSMLASRIGSFGELAVADLFAGTGALGLEALSRGAASCLFVEQDRAAIEILRKNIARLDADRLSDVLAQNVMHAAPPPRPCDLIFLDPPYATGLAQQAIDRIADPRWIGSGGLASIELAGETIDPGAHFAIEAERRYGKATIILLRRA